jgi:DNA uptake protein ComE-like DNA-binding protein
MAHDNDLDLWQTDASDATDKHSVLRQVPVKRALLEQRRLDLQAITNLLTRAADDLRASERRAIEAETRAAEAETRAAAAEERAAEAEERAAGAEEREKRINAQAARAFQTMKERIESSDARAAEAEARARIMENRSNDALLQLDRRAAEIEKAAEERSFELETRLEAAEMRIAAARGALGDGLALAQPLSGKSATGSASSENASAAYAPDPSAIIDIKMRH